MILEYPIDFAEDGSIAFLPISLETTEAMGARVLAEYPTYLVAEVPDSQLEQMIEVASNEYVAFELRPDFDLIQVNGFTFLASGDGPELPQGFQIGRYNGNQGLYLVQFEAPPKADWLADLRMRAEVIGYLPQNTYIVRCSAKVAGELNSLPLIQFVGLFQPAFKTHPSLFEPLPKQERPISIHLDSSRDLDDVEAFLTTLNEGEASIQGFGVFSFSRFWASDNEIAEVAKRVEAVWLEPSTAPILSGERQAMVTAGLHDGTRPDDPEPGVTHDGYEEWLLGKGFCTPGNAPQGCHPYWTKVALFDSGLNTMVCGDADYDGDSGSCDNWTTAFTHPDLEHSSNLVGACSGLGPECYAPVIRGYYCAEGHNQASQCFVNNEWVFTDSASHGTSTASIIASMPAAQPIEQDAADYFRGTGIAPSAQILLSRFGTFYGGGGNTDPGTSEIEYATLLSRVNTRGARFASNSWNLKDTWYDPNDPPQAPIAATGYTGFSQMVDRLVRDASGTFSSVANPMTLVFSAGNEGTWVLSPANAKNVISVGASRGWSTLMVGGVSGAAHDDCYNLAHEIDDIAGGIGWNSNRMYVGEDDTGSLLPRYKPDLIAPGTQIAAAAPQGPQATDFYQCFRGTSAAAPAVTASAVLADAWFYWVLSGAQATPSPAMVRAMLVAYADDMESGFDYSSSSLLGHSPSPPQGWGRVNMDRLLQTDTSVFWLDEDHQTVPTRRFTDSGQSWSQQLVVDDPSKSIIAVLVFTDAASQPSATGGLVVNDLNLRIYKPGTFRTRRYYFGNLFKPSSEYSQPVLDPQAILVDQRNTVEVIRIEPGELTTPFSLEIQARVIAEKAVPGLDAGANQDFAIFVFNAEVAP